MRFIDLDLARRVEMAEAHAGRACAEACQRFHPEHSVAIEEIAGGVAVFAGVCGFADYAGHRSGPARPRERC
jgi:hypothetical protein